MNTKGVQYYVWVSFVYRANEILSQVCTRQTDCLCVSFVLVTKAGCRPGEKYPSRSVTLRAIGQRIPPSDVTLRLRR